MTNAKHRKNGEGTLFKRKDGRWQASFIPENGKRQYVYGKTQGEALEKLRKLQQEDKQGILATGPKQALGEYITQWLEHVHKPKVRVSTYVSYRSLIINHIIPDLGQIPLQKLTPQQVQAFYSTLLEAGLSPQSVACIHAVLHSAMENAVRWNLVSRNVVSLVSAPHLIRHDPQVLTSEEAKVLLATASGSRMYVLLIIAVTTGMRRGEILALRWNDINLSDGIVSVHRTVNHFPGYGFVENDPKTKSSRRKIVLPNIVITALHEHKVSVEKLKVQAGSQWTERNLVFCNHNGGYLYPRYVQDRFHKICSDAGLPYMRFHDLRHSAATILLTMGVHPKVVQELLGHSSIVMTMNTYSHVLPSMQKDAMSKINDALSDPGALDGEL